MSAGVRGAGLRVGHRGAGTLFYLLLLLGFMLFLWTPVRFEALLRPLAPAGAPALYPATPLWLLTLLHLRIVLVSVGAAGVVALGLAILVTRPSGRGALPLARTIVSAAQTFPPVAVLAVLVPLLGFGDGPVAIALFLYGLLPVFETSVGALERVPPPVLEAARGCGLTAWQRLIGVELPLARGGIVAGFRVSLVTGLGLAALGSTVSSRTLGEVMVAGLLSANGAFVVQGAVLVGCLAVLVSWPLSRLGR